MAMKLPTIAQGNLRAHGTRDRHRTGDQFPASGDAPAAMRLGRNGAARRGLNGGLHRGRRSGGFTLIEMLVSLAITLIMMGAVVTLFSVISESVAGSRTAIEMADRLRAARDQLQLDLQGATATMKPPLRPENDEGYFEIIEGPESDQSVGTAYSLFGDFDDVLMFTVRNRSAPFLGKVAGTTVIESPVAEVVYFLAQDGPVIDAIANPAVRLCTLYRRVLLISPSVGNITNATVPITLEPEFYTKNDLSVRFVDLGGTLTLVPNNLGDLTKRENRFAHYGTDLDALGNVVGNYMGFPFLVNRKVLPTVPFLTTLPVAPVSGVIPSWPPGPPARPDENAFLAPFNGARLGDDVLLTNVLAFDVQVWDPTAIVRSLNGVGLEPGDVGWNSAGVTDTAAGAYVNLGYTVTNVSVFSDRNPALKPTTTVVPPTAIYDTWSLHYENDGIDNATGAAGGDFGTDGLDHATLGTVGVVDDSGEFDTSPFYAAPLRGIRVTIRVYEPNSKMVREAVVIQNFDTK